MGNFVINNLVAPDAPTAASTLDNLPICDHININVLNQAIYWQVKRYKNDGLQEWDQPVYMPQGFLPLYRSQMCGILFYAAIPAAQLGTLLQARVTVEAVI